MKLFLATGQRTGNVAVDEDDRLLMFQDRLPGLKVLLSYHYHQNLRHLYNEHLKNVIDELMIDSGAFSAFTLGATIDVHEYGKWCRENLDLMSTIASLDVVGDPVAGYQNAIILKRQYNLKVMPTYHVGEPFDWFKRYIDDGFDYLALGGMVPHSRRPKHLAHWLDETWNAIEKLGVKNLKVHGFGMTNLKFMLAFPWHSVDSSSWTICFRQGVVQLFDERKGLFQSITYNDRYSCIRNADIIMRYGLTPQDVFDMTSDGFQAQRLARLSLVSWLRVERWINKKKESIQ